MDSNEHNKVIAFDTLFCTNHIQMLKIMLSYMDNQTQKSMAVYIKFLELNYTIEYFKKHPYPLYGCMEQEASFDVLKMCSELLPYCSESERKQLEQIKGIFQGIEMYKEMSRTMDMMKDFMPDMASFMGDSSMGGAFQSFFGGDSAEEGAGESDSQSKDSYQEAGDTFIRSTSNGDASTDNGVISDFDFHANDTSTGDTAGEHADSQEVPGNFNMMNMLMNMLTPEQKQMYEMFGGNQNAK